MIEHYRPPPVVRLTHGIVGSKGAVPDPQTPTRDTQDVVALIHNALTQAGYAVRGVGGDGASGAVFEISHPAEPNLAISLAVYPTPR